MSDTSFGFLILGSIGAVGFALAVGTLAAMGRYRRTGSFPGHEPGQVLEQRDWVKLWARVIGGTAIGIYGVYVVVRSGVLT